MSGKNQQSLWDLKRNMQASRRRWDFIYFKFFWITTEVCTSAFPPCSYITAKTGLQYHLILASYFEKVFFVQSAYTINNGTLQHAVRGSCFWISLISFQVFVFFQPYHCKYCERSFSISSNLQRHIHHHE